MTWSSVPALLRRDSVHGAFDGTIRVDEERQSFVANGNEIKVIYADAPDTIDYTQYGIDNAIIIDNTGVWRDEAGLSLHLKSKGASKVILTAPGKGDLKNVVAGINNDIIDCAGHYNFGRLLYHQCHSAAAESDGRRVRHRCRPC